MKKMLIAFVLTGIMALSFVTPVIATTGSMTVTAEQEIAPRIEMTRIYWRTYHGQLQFRVWGMTSGRWLTDLNDAI